MGEGGDVRGSTEITAGCMYIVAGIVVDRHFIRYQ